MCRQNSDQKTTTNAASLFVVSVGAGAASELFRWVATPNNDSADLIARLGSRSATRSEMSSNSPPSRSIRIYAGGVVCDSNAI